jgi:hypothetical protein
MINLSWVRTHPRPAGRAARRKPLTRLRVEPLEDRCVPATFTVNSTADTATPPAGTVTLRSAIMAAEGDTGDTINFDPALLGQTITLTSGSPLPALTKGETITGLGAKNLTVSGNNAFRVFNVTSATQVKITDLTATQGNSGAVGDGGAIINSGNLALTNVIISASTSGANRGGGFDNAPGGTATITGSTITSNSTTGGLAGGGINNEGDLIVTTSTISSNSGSGGGGIENRLAGTLAVLQSLIVGNTARDDVGGGGIRSVGTSVQITNTTIAYNVVSGVGATEGGGGVSLGAGTMTILNSTITGNTDLSNLALGGGGINHSGGTLNLGNTIVAENFAVGANPQNIGGGFTNLGGTVNGGDPRLGPLQNNGGPTLSRAPLPGSTVIGAGINGLIAGTTVDQRGSLRIVGTTVDIGAVEFQPPQVSVALTVTPTSPIPFHRVVTLDVTVTPAATSPAPNNTVTGTVTFLVNGTTVLGTATLDASGHATFTTTPNNPLPVGTDQITARYEGDFNYSAGLSNVVTEQVIRPVPTPAVFDPATATWYLRNSFTGGPPSIAAFQFGSPGDEPIMGDWDGDGVFTVGVFTPSTATFHLRNSNSPGPANLTFVFGPTTADLGGNNAVPVAGDWNGDGIWTVGVFAPSRGDWNLRNENSGGLPDAGSFLYGALNSKPVVGDWNGDGKFTQGVIEPDGTWKLKNDPFTGPPDFTFAYGAFADQLVAGDWNGDGVWSPGALENTAGALTWKLRNSNTAGPPDITPFTYGGATFLGVVGDFNFPALPEFALGGQGAGAAGIRQADLNAIVQAALGRLQQAGVSADVLSRLATVTAYIHPLLPGQLGEALPAQNAIVLSPDAAGNGWFVDPTPYQDEEFSGGTAVAGSPAAGREDLLTTVLHELGHIVGLPDDNGTALMAELLPTGVRRTDALNVVFASNAAASFLA